MTADTPQHTTWYHNRGLPYTQPNVRDIHCLCTSCRVDSGHAMQKPRKFYFMWSCDKGRQYQWWPQDMALQGHDQHDTILNKISW